MTRHALVVIGGVLSTLVFATAAIGLIVAGGRADVPDNWGFRGYWVLMAFLFTMPGANLALRRPRNVIGWILLFVGGTTALTGAMQEYVTYGAFLRPGAVPFVEIVAWVLSWSWLVAISPILIILLIFPTGRLLSTRWRYAVAGTAGFIVVSAVTFAFRPGPLENASAVTVNPFGASGRLEDFRKIAEIVTQISFVAIAAVGAAAPLIRFRRARADERQQLKWFAYSAVALAISVLVLIATGTSKLGQILVLSAMGTVPVSVAIAVLRYRLYDIDLIINRTIVYGLLSAVLGGSYFVLVVLLQALLSPLTTGSEIAVAVSTLAVVGFIQPLRRRIQGAVDRRFYRSRYDAARILDALASRLRDEVELDAVRADIVDVVATTMRPRHASLWLRGRRA